MCDNLLNSSSTLTWGLCYVWYDTRNYGGGEGVGTDSENKNKEGNCEFLKWKKEKLKTKVDKK